MSWPFRNFGNSLDFVAPCVAAAVDWLAGCLVLISMLPPRAYLHATPCWPCRLQRKLALVRLLRIGRHAAITSGVLWRRWWRIGRHAAVSVVLQCRSRRSWGITTVVPMSISIVRCRDDRHLVATTVWSDLQNLHVVLARAQTGRRRVLILKTLLFSTLHERTHGNEDRKLQFITRRGHVSSVMN